MKYRVGFSLIPGVGRVRLGQLEGYFDALKDAWTASPSELKHAGLDGGVISAFTSMRDKIDLEDEMEKLARHNVGVLDHHDSRYPSRLKEI